MSVNMSFESMPSLADLSFSTTYFATTTTGSKLLEPLCDKIGLPIDKVSTSATSYFVTSFVSLLVYQIN